MQSYAFFIGIDISKSWIDVCLTTDGKVDKVSHSRFDNNTAGFEQMLKFIRQSPLFVAVTKKDIKKCLFCMEHTGVYTLPLCEFFEKEGLSYVLESPYHLKRSLGIRRGKSDKVDAAYIARYAYLHRQELTLSKLPSDTLLNIKHLLSLRDRLVKSKKGLEVAANELQAFAKATVSQGVCEATLTIAEQMDKTINGVEKQIRQLIKEDAQLEPLFVLADSVKGVGTIIAAALLVYTVGFTAFDDGRKFATYIGLAPFGQSSGSSTNTSPKVSHLANKPLKGLISCGASSAMIHDKELNAYYKRRIEAGKNKFVVQNAVRNKFVHRIFAVVKRGTPYVELAKHRAA